MDHKNAFLIKVAAIRRQAFLLQNLFLSVLVFASLICNTAAGLASGLAGSLAFAATAVLCAFAKVTSFDCLDMFHFNILRKCKLISVNYTPTAALSQ